MLRIFGAAVLCVFVCSLMLGTELGPNPAKTTSRKIFPGTTWDKAKTPEELGWSSEKLRLAKEYSSLIGSTAVMVVDSGQIVDQWGETEKRINVLSVRKSFLSALYGIYVAENKIKLTSTLAELGIDDSSGLTASEKQATVQQLLQARSGVYHPALYETPEMRALRPQRGSHAPGSFWYYNNWDFNALGTIFEKQTGLSIFKAFKQRIAEPLQMEDFRLVDGAYFRGESGVNSIHPAYPFRMSARDMARFALLYLRHGEWNGRQIIPKDWIAESTKPYSFPEGEGGYGYMWWIASGGKHFPNVQLPDGSYSARGSAGQYILVIPAYNLVIIHRFEADGPVEGVTGEEFGRLVKLILDARPNDSEGSLRADLGEWVRSPNIPLQSR